MAVIPVSDIFDYFDGAVGKAVDVELADAECLTVRPMPGEPPFIKFEVIFDHDPEKYWSKYADKAGLVYENVPELLISHHIVTHGGIECISRVQTRQPFVVHIELHLDRKYERLIWWVAQETYRLVRRGTRALSGTFTITVL